MVVTKFTKYQGTGNDFIVVDNFTNQQRDFDIQDIQLLCDRRFGVGADGLIVVEKSNNSDFYMNYFNADGSKSFCGNGARCAVHYAKTLGIISEKTTFEAIDGTHGAFITHDSISIIMQNVSKIRRYQADFVLNTGSPHYIKISDDISSETVLEQGNKIRYSAEFKDEGINVNLMKEVAQDTISIATYERGVENETLSCGTGATACAIILNELNPIQGERKVKVLVKGGELLVSYKANESKYTDIILSGPATPVFHGTF